MNDYLTGFKHIEFDTSKFTEKRAKFITSYLLNKTATMFQYDGLPETLDARHIELLLQINGNVCITKVNNKLYGFYGGLGGELDEYYEPTIYTIANPYLKYDANLRIGVDCVRGRSDTLGLGLIPLLRYYATMQAVNEQSIYIASINSRAESLISADNDTTFKSAQSFIDDLKDGKISPIYGSAFFEGLQTAPFTSSATNTIKTLIELEQYIKASVLNELGINANYNMKRERLEDSEAGLNDAALIPFIEDMLHNRQIMCDEINAMYDTNISVKLAGVWKREEEKQTLDMGLDTSEVEKEQDEHEIKEDIEDIKEDIEDIKEMLEGGEDDGEN